jgi:hypothetical protein
VIRRFCGAIGARSVGDRRAIAARPGFAANPRISLMNLERRSTGKGRGDRHS